MSRTYRLTHEDRELLDEIDSINAMELFDEEDAHGCDSGEDEFDDLYLEFGGEG